MSLKQECIDMISLVTDSLRTEDLDMYELESDTIRNICTHIGTDVTYGIAAKCDICDDWLCDRECEYYRTVKVDVSFTDSCEVSRNYVFSPKPNIPCNGIRYIRSRKELMLEMAELKKELEKFKDYYADFGERYMDYLDYAKEFSEQLQNDYFFFTGLCSDFIPIVFRLDFNRDKSGNYEYDIAGHVNYCDKQIVINIFDCMEDVESVKRTIRHEILHYYLLISDMKHQDDSAVFHYLCNKYDAHAYKDMPEDEQRLYDDMEDVIQRYYSATESSTSVNEKDKSIMVSAIVYYMGAVKDKVKYQKIYDLAKKQIDGLLEHEVIGANYNTCCLTARQCDKKISDVLEDYVFPVEELKDFTVTMQNTGSEKIPKLSISASDIIKDGLGRMLMIMAVLWGTMFFAICMRAFM